MREHKTAYELARSQVVTPLPIVRLLWDVTHRYRSRLSRVLDLGAGDGRFAIGGRYESYEGVEIDRSKAPTPALPGNADLRYACAFDHAGTGYTACVGNPPYVRHHDLEEGWRDAVARRLREETGLTINRKCNLYVYFMFLALLKTADDGLVSLLVPYEWVSRPSAEPLRRFISRNGWHVDAYRFSGSVFSGVLTTVSLSVIDKRNRDGQWRYGRVNSQGAISDEDRVTGSASDILPYEGRGRLYAMRGMSPGTQKVFTLTEGERIHAGLRHDDVFPCVTSLRDVPRNLRVLTPAAFRKRFIEAGARCWLIRSHTEDLSPRLQAYLASVPQERRNTWTCASRDPWYRYPLFDAPGLVVSAGFTSFGPKALVNAVSARTVGAACGVYADRDCCWSRVRDFLAGVNFEKRVVSHAKQLKKVEVRQLNAVLNRFHQWETRHG